MQVHIKKIKQYMQQLRCKICHMIKKNIDKLLNISRGISLNSAVDRAISKVENLNYIVVHKVWPIIKDKVKLSIDKMLFNIKNLSSFILDKTLFAKKCLAQIVKDKGIQIVPKLKHMLVIIFDQKVVKQTSIKLVQGVKRVLNKEFWKTIYTNSVQTQHSTYNLHLVKGKNIQKQQTDLLKPLYSLNLNILGKWKQLLNKRAILSCLNNLLNVRTAVIICCCLASIGFITTLVSKGNVQAYYNADDIQINAYQIKLDGNDIGIVRDKQQILNIIKEIKDDFYQQYGKQAVVSQDMSVKLVQVDKADLTDEDELKQKIQAEIDMKVKAAAILINGETVAVVKDRQVAEQILSDIKHPYIKSAQDANNELKVVALVEDVQIEDVSVKYSSIQDKEQVYNKIVLGTDQIKEYEVQEGDSLWSIARQNDISVQDIKQANPQLMNSEIIKPGEKLRLVVAKSLVNVKTVEVVEYIDDIPFETQEKKTSALYVNESRIVQKGEQGKKEVVAEVEKHNGKQVSQKIISEKIIQQPVPQIVEKGTKPLPPKKGTGVLSMPTRGRITSRFGPRWGGFHKGVDIASNTGTPIYASDGGVVLQACWSGAYGKMILIDHGAGVKTRYAHCSSLLVSAGSRVEKGQLIARMGSTGNSTGPHLHFEVIINGKVVNPLSKLN